ncbi:uncharacterized protein EKO05_0003340 [Ascochyta rabiei]|nr:uncharacterized protein EKO05_0003340 [Ascochyta rabiei]UPX12803.1 hypothetical protein EKO05_0003340 [Ascochyta rabiei]
MESLELKMGVLDLLQTLRKYGHKIAVITEGPQDVQERTVKCLGLVPYIDYLATIKELVVAKVEGLFVKVLEHLGLRPKDVIMIGDSLERDIVPATHAGMYCVHFTSFEATYDEQIQIERFDTLKKLVEHAHSCSVD